MAAPIQPTPIPETERRRVQQNVAVMRAKGATEADIQHYLQVETAHAQAAHGAAAATPDATPSLMDKVQAGLGATAMGPVTGREVGDFLRGTLSAGGVRQLAQGLSFGWGDEAEAAVRSLLPGRTYQGELADVRHQMHAHEAAYPHLSVAQELAGAAAPLALTGGASAPATGAELTAEAAPTLGRVALKSAAIGAGAGAIGGAGKAETHKGAGAIGGAIGGAILGGALPYAARGVKWAADATGLTSALDHGLAALEGRGGAPAAREPGTALARVTPNAVAPHAGQAEAEAVFPGVRVGTVEAEAGAGSPRPMTQGFVGRRADALIRQRLAEAGVTPAQAALFFQRLKEQGVKPETLVDLNVEGLKGMVRAAASFNGPARDLVTTAHRTRGLGMPARLADDVGSAFGFQDKTTQQVIDELLAERRTADDAAYGLVRERFGHAPVQDGRLRTLFGKRTVQGAYEDIVNSLHDDGIATPSVEDLASGKASLTVDALHRLKIHLDRLAKFSAMGNPEARLAMGSARGVENDQVLRFRQQLLDILDDATRESPAVEAGAARGTALVPQGQRGPGGMALEIPTLSAPGGRSLYGEARTQSAKYARLVKLVREGEEAFNRMEPADLQRRILALTDPEEREAFRFGAGRTLLNTRVWGKTAGRSLASASVATAPDKARVVALFADDPRHAAALLGNAAREGNMAASDAFLLGNSNTASKLREGDQLAAEIPGGFLEQGGQIPTSIPALAWNLAKKSAAKARYGMVGRLGQAVAERGTLTGPELQAYLQQLEQQAARGTGPEATRARTILTLIMSGQAGRGAADGQ